MTKVNICLKRLLTIFNIFFAIIGGLVLCLAFLTQTLTFSHVQVEGRSTVLIALYLFGSITMVIAVLGAYGSHKESKGCLIAFLVCMVIGSMAMLRTGIPAAAMRPKAAGVLEEKLRMLLPLDTATSDVRVLAESLQLQAHCCGMFSYKDWEDNIPDSCLCSRAAEMQGICQNVFIGMRSKVIYEEACFPIIRHYFLFVVDFMIGVAFTLAALALLGMALSSLMIHQMRYTNRSQMVMTVPAVFSGMPPKYEELQNPPEY
ncbi:hypothetical protein PBY51_009072 [Eleginops maclovinus]|uniref:Tetraspanin n=1 Tax=Eleginops maclovinus TaxID=56733 RepID=A0AAN8ABS2_ELEMC|nr:hypothetical protein PBY51_009072 [Eleginops maclovinus]